MRELHTLDARTRRVCEAHRGGHTGGGLFLWLTAGNFVRSFERSESCQTSQPSRILGREGIKEMGPLRWF